MMSWNHIASYINHSVPRQDPTINRSIGLIACMQIKVSDCGTERHFRKHKDVIIGSGIVLGTDIV